MSYLWQEFNIKTYPSETLVFRDGIFCPELSDYESLDFDKKHNLISVIKTPKLPIHIIYIGEISGDIDFNIDIKSFDTKVYMTAKIINKKPAFLNILVNNYGENSVFDGQIISQNYDNIKINTNAKHFIKNSSVFIKTHVLAHKNTQTELNGSAYIEKNAPNCDSNISFSVMANESAKIILKPCQYIKSIPNQANHSASLYKMKENQIEYLRSSGLSGKEVENVLQEAFLAEQ